VIAGVPDAAVEEFLRQSNAVATRDAREVLAVVEHSTHPAYACPLNEEISGAGLTVLGTACAHRQGRRRVQPDDSGIPPPPLRYWSAGDGQRVDGDMAAAAAIEWLPIPVAITLL
jgi:hypothetical protein